MRGPPARKEGRRSHSHSRPPLPLQPGWERRVPSERGTGGPALVLVEFAVTVRSRTGFKSQPCHFLANNDLSYMTLTSLLPLSKMGTDAA